MRKRTIIITSLMPFLLGACIGDGECDTCPDSQNGWKPKEEKAVLKVSTGFPEEGPESRALASYTGVQDYEKAVNDVQILVFNAAGQLNAYKDLGTSTSATISTTVGEKSIWAVANGPDLSGIAEEEALEKKAVTLAENSTDVRSGFIMTGSTACKLTTSGAEASVTVSRLTSRIALMSVRNALPAVYPSLTVRKVYAINVAGSQNLSGTAVQGADTNVGSDRGDCPALLSRTVSRAVSNGQTYTPGVPLLFYGYANSTPKKTRLVVEAEIGGNTYYYPVTLPSMERNRTYTVALTIENLGSDDPDRPVEKGAVSVSISVEPWKSGADYDETI